MGLLDFMKKKEKSEGDTTVNTNCCCNNNSCVAEDENCSFIVLGACCQKSEDTFKNVKQAVSELGIKEKVANIGDNIIIAKYGVLQTPALVINNKVVSYGKLIKVDEAKKLIEKFWVNNEL